LIGRYQSEPVTNPPRSVVRYDYKGAVVYFVPAQCCDAFATLYDANGRVMCAPEGGITGRGDGRCPDFLAERRNAGPESRSLARKVHQTIRKVTEDIEGLQFNTAAAALMELVNDLTKYVQAVPMEGPSEVFSEALEMLLTLLSPMAPHIADDLWAQLGHEGFMLNVPWPEYDAEVAKADEVTIVVQINGKVRDKLVVPADMDQKEVERLALESDKIRPQLDGKQVRNIVVVPGRLVNVVVG
jgi:leucyl-tRNA synthetase